MHCQEGLQWLEREPKIDRHQLIHVDVIWMVLTQIENAHSGSFAFERVVELDMRIAGNTSTGLVHLLWTKIPSIWNKRRMLSETSATRIPTELLKRITNVLNRVAQNPIGLEIEVTNEINSVRKEIFALSPVVGTKRTRSTDGPSYDQVYNVGVRLGARAVSAHSGRIRLARTDEDAFELVIMWMRARRQAALDMIIDGADPEYHSLVGAYDKGVENGIRAALNLEP